WLFVPARAPLPLRRGSSGSAADRSGGRGDTSRRRRDGPDRVRFQGLSGARCRRLGRSARRLIRRSDRPLRPCVAYPAAIAPPTDSACLTIPVDRSWTAGSGRTGSMESLDGQSKPRYAPCMNRLRLLLERLRGVRRPPTGPLTTSEKTAADDLRQETQPKVNERIERNQVERPPP